MYIFLPKHRVFFYHFHVRHWLKGNGKYFFGILLCVVSRVLGTEGGAVPDMQGGDVSLFFPTLTSHSI